MLWQIPLLLFLLSVNQATAAVAIARNTKGSNTITLPLQRSYIGNEHFKSVRKRSVDSSPLIDKVVQYVAVIGVGNPPTNYTLIVDTGSSNIHIGSSKAYVKTATSTDLNSTFDIEYESANATGEMYKDQVMVSPSLIITDQIIGVVSKPISDINGVDGIIGLGPTGLTNGTSTYEKLIPTTMDNLFSQKKIPSDQFAISFQPSTTESDANGEITFGGIDASKFTGSMTYVPITTASPASEFWGIDASASYGTGMTSIFNSTSGIVDSGTTLTSFSSDAYLAYQRATGAVLDKTTGLLTVTAAQYAAMQSIYFDIGGIKYEFTPNAQIFPRNLNTRVGGDANKIYLIISERAPIPGSNFGFVLGQTFMERFYVTFDAGNNRIGFATTEFTNATSN
ncbi:unnamed protein product [Umbelopsis ramanniana]